MTKCKHRRVEITLETNGLPVWESDTVKAGRPQENKEKSAEEWTGGVRYVCLVCGDTGRYSGSQVPKWLIRHLNQLPVWGRITRHQFCPEILPVESLEPEEKRKERAEVGFV